MLKSSMARILTVTFICSCLVVTLFIKLAGNYMHAAQDKSLEEETNVLHATIIETFSRYMKRIRDVSEVVTDILESEKMQEHAYKVVAQSIIKVNKEIIGLNLLDPKGVIYKVYPYEGNKLALGKVSQNYNVLKTALANKQQLYFSPPFELYQKKVGFIFYRAIGEGANFKGWAAIVIDAEAFLKRFQFDKFLHHYHLAIKDEETGKEFFTTNHFSSYPGKIFENEASFIGRKVYFYSYPKSLPKSYKVSLWLCILISIFISGLITYLVRLILLNQESKRKLSHLKALLDQTYLQTVQISRSMNQELTSTENFDHSRKKLEGYLYYLSHLCQEMTVTNTLARPLHEHDGELSEVNIFTVIHDQIDFNHEMLTQENVSIDFSSSEEELRVKAYSWLLCHTGFGNIIRYMGFMAKRGSEIKITSINDGNKTIISFFINRDGDKKNDPLAEIYENGLKAAKEVFAIHGIRYDEISNPRDFLIVLNIS
jgi:sensor domain CHASE-containing protein